MVCLKYDACPESKCTDFLSITTIFIWTGKLLFFDIVTISLNAGGEPGYIFFDAFLEVVSRQPFRPRLYLPLHLSGV